MILVILLKFQYQKSLLAIRLIMDNYPSKHDASPHKVRRNRDLTVTFLAN